MLHRARDDGIGCGVVLGGLAGCTSAQFKLQPCDRMEKHLNFNSLVVFDRGGLAGLHGFQGETPPSPFLAQTQTKAQHPRGMLCLC